MNTDYEGTRPPDKKHKSLNQQKFRVFSKTRKSTKNMFLFTFLPVAESQRSINADAERKYILSIFWHHVPRLRKQVRRIFIANL